MTVSDEQVQALTFRVVALEQMASEINTLASHCRKILADHGENLKLLPSALAFVQTAKSSLDSSGAKSQAAEQAIASFDKRLTAIVDDTRTELLNLSKLGDAQGFIGQKDAEIKALDSRISALESRVVRSAATEPELPHAPSLVPPANPTVTT